MHGALPVARDRTLASPQNGAAGNGNGAHANGNGNLEELKSAVDKALPRLAGGAGGLFSNIKIPPLFFYGLTALLLFSAWARHAVYDNHDPLKCDALLSHGAWLDPPGTGRSPTPLQKWQPPGCMARPYNSKGVSACLAWPTGDGAPHGNVLFVGDSTAREVFWAMARKLDKDAATKHQASISQKHADVIFKSGALTLDFVWDPYLNSTQLSQSLAATRADADRSSSKSLMVVGSGLWFARLPDGVEMFKNAMDKAAELAHGHNADAPNAHAQKRLLFMPVQPPFYRLLDAEHTAQLLPKDISAMNTYMADLKGQYSVDVLMSFLDMEAGAASHQQNGLHVTPGVADRQVDVLLNARCNNEYQAYPFTGTCCYEYPVTLAQIVLIFVGFVGLAAVVIVDGSGRYFHSSLDSVLEGAKKHLPLARPVLVLWAALYYCYLADRTHLFDKYHKQYNTFDFFLMVAGIVAAGALTIKKSVNPTRPGQDKPSNQDQPFLSRDQTDEWKGWMQVLILAYHYTGGSKVLWIYKIIRLLVASYLFMSGYGHAAYFYQKKDFSLKRVVAVNIRLNLLSCVLPWMTGADYLFYYFAPLVTYWYAVIFLTMYIRSDLNQNLTFFLSKICAAALATSLLHTQPQLLEPAFRVINGVFGSQWDAKEWLFRCQLDQFIVYIGMVVAVLYIRHSKPPPPPPPPQDPLASTAHTKPGSNQRFGQGAFFAADAVLIFTYAYLSSTQTTKSGSNAYHTYISPLVILAFIHLRNATPTLRNYYSGAYAWVGKISLETFVMQYHLWLAADTRGVLSLGIFGSGGMANGTRTLTSGMGLARWLDCVLLGIVFVWVSSKVAAATGSVTALLMKKLF